MRWETTVNFPEKAVGNPQDEQTIQRLLAGVRQLPRLKLQRNPLQELGLPHFLPKN
jgi:hypothetical protein